MTDKALDVLDHPGGLDRLALVVVDVQRGFDDAEFWGPRNNPACDDNIARLVTEWSELGRPLVYVRHDSEEPGSPLHPDSPGNALKDYLTAEPDLRVTKSVNSSFHGSPDLHAWLGARDLEGVVVCGITTNHCCETTARVGGNLGHRVLFAVDATHTFDRTGPDGTVVTADELARVTATNLHGEFAEVVRTEDLLPVKRVGLIGGMSWESSAEYYRLLNELVRERLGGLHSAECLLYSVDFAEVEAMQAEGRWDDAADRLAAAARALEAGGAELLLLCTNTMHKVAESVEAAVSVPLLHLADTTAAAVHDAGLGTVGLLGTTFTMEQDFYRDRLAGHGLTVLVPEEDDRALVHRVIYDELCLGVVREASRTAYQGVIGRLVEAGAEGVVLGCTEIELLVGQADSPVPVFPTTRLHVLAAVDAALA